MNADVLYRTVNISSGNHTIVCYSISPNLYINMPYLWPDIMCIDKFLIKIWLNIMFCREWSCDRTRIHARMCTQCVNKMLTLFRHRLDFNYEMCTHSTLTWQSVCVILQQRNEISRAEILLKGTSIQLHFRRIVTATPVRTQPLPHQTI